MVSPLSPVLTVLRLLETGDHSGLQQYLSSDNIELEESDQEGWSVLFHSVQQNNLPFVTSLLERGSNPNKSDSAGRTPLVVAVSVNSLQIVRCLIAFGAEVSQRDCDSWPALVTACYLVSCVLQLCGGGGLVPPKIVPFQFRSDLSLASRTRVTCEAAEGDLPLTFHW